MIAARRFFVEGAGETGGVVEIGGGDARKIVRVLRLQEGDRIEVIDSTAAVFAASIDVAGRVVRAKLVERIAGDAGDHPAPRIDVAQAVPKGQRMEYVVEKGTELGTASFLPFFCERSIGRTLGAEKLARWRRLARTAAQQCGRRDVPAILDALNFDELVERFSEYDAVLFAWELAEAVPLRETLAPALRGARRVLLVVGPEGGFTHDEAEAARQRGAAMLWLGPRILRTDTAALALLAVIGALAS